MKYMDIKKYIKNIYNGFYEIFIERNDKKHLQKFIDEKQWEKENTIYYVISCEKLPFLGLFGYVEIILAMAKYALERDMVPVVDFKNYPNSYLESNEIGKINAWELFFQQFTKKTLDEIYENCKYIVGNHMDIDWSNLPNIRGVKRRDIGTYWKVMYQNYIKFSKEAEKYCQKEYDALLKGKEAETLGVLVRGTDIKLFKGHALQPSLEQVEEKIRKILKKDHRFKYLYLATEEKKSEDYLKEKFPGMVITNKRTYYDTLDYQKGLSYVDLDGIKTKYDRGMEYLSSMNLLSKCGGLTAGQCGGSFAAFYMNGGKYRYTYFWDIGVVE